ncbi:MAG: hypothetical protein WBV82_17715 [Myxococcaceae bacterium]
MRTRRLCSAISVVAITLLLAPPPAEARFGKTRVAPHVDEASESAQPPEEPTAPNRGYAHRRRRHPEVIVVPAPVYVAPVYGGHAPPTPPPPPPPVEVERHEPPPPPRRERNNIPRFQLTGMLQRAPHEGLLASVHLRAEGARFGVDAHFDHYGPLFRGGRDGVRLLNVSGAWALFRIPDVRLRVHLGAYGVLTSKMASLGPGVGASLDVHVLGPLYLDAASHLVIFPYSELDANAGAALRLGPVALKAGVRGTRLDERVGEVPLSDFRVGPYVGAGLMF